MNVEKSKNIPAVILQWFLCLLFFLIINAGLNSLPFPVSEPEGWEPDEVEQKTVLRKDESIEKDLNESLAVSFIRFYQENINPNSITRCPFYISCSNFALQAIQKYGFIPGVILFIDRIYYRENSEAFKHYPKKRNDEFYLKLNDSFFLNGGSIYE
ncbi:MAG: membrane protein insertion efficiency factor YidD [Spirochaetales bacterium]|nr:membrane protein insertion efficiency factor YidD [Spirochaetales bacterium]